VTRTLFAFAEMTNMDPGYAGPEFDFDMIIFFLFVVAFWYFTFSFTHTHQAKDS
jgi:hypothetical protein